MLFNISINTDDMLEWNLMKNDIFTDGTSLAIAGLLGFTVKIKNVTSEGKKIWHIPTVIRSDQRENMCRSKTSPFRNNNPR